MQLTLRLLDDAQNVNSWEPVTDLVVAAGDPQAIFFQVVVNNPKRNAACGPVENMRYMPEAGATMSVVLDNIDVAKKVTKVAVQPFATDGSIWRVDLTSQDSTKLAGTVSVSFALTEGLRVVSGRLLAALTVK